MKQIEKQMDKKAYSYMQFQSSYYANQADDTALMEKTTQPFWQSMRLSKRRLVSKGITMDVEITHDSKSNTIKDEQMHIRKDGHHLIGNKALNVLVKRKFYKDGKKLTIQKNREICNISLLKAEVNGEQAACPNCGYVNTITSFVDGCDACDSKFTVQDFDSKISGFSLEENTGAKIKDTVRKYAKSIGLFIGGFLLLGIIALIFAAMRLLLNSTEIDIAGVIVSLYMSFIMTPVSVKVFIILLIVYTAGTSFLLSIYKKPIIQESIIKGQLTDFSARDFYQNLEYKLRNIHLTDNLDEIKVFARCALGDFVKDYSNVIECDMTRLKFLQFQADEDGYRVRVETEMRLTEYVRKRVFTNYEKLNLTLFGKPAVINKSITALREYKCPGCGSSINVLEGGKCAHCGNEFDYSEFGWVIESYQSTREKISLYQSIKYGMLTIFIGVFGLHILFPMGIDRENIFQIYEIFSEQATCLENMFEDMERPDELYEGVTLLSSSDRVIQRVNKYEAVNAAEVIENYRMHLEEKGFVFYKETEDSYIFYQTFMLGDLENAESYYRITVTVDGSNIKLAEDMVSDLDEELDLELDIELDMDLNITGGY